MTIPRLIFVPTRYFLLSAGILLGQKTGRENNPMRDHLIHILRVNGLLAGRWVYCMMVTPEADPINARSALRDANKPTVTIPAILFKRVSIAVGSRMFRL